MPIIVDVDVMLARRKMSVGALAERVGITPANLAVLKNGRAKAVRFTTLAALCDALGCQPGDLLRWEPEGGSENGAKTGDVLAADPADPGPRRSPLTE
ncbi:MAG TPA: helix-turn-helix transcriptional regulator [Nocardioidaceae bacterium]|nr:helix-turn-helix transcriptional regulator [Nocardioidaceae bacterium]